jgi:hypothetical protein
MPSGELAQERAFLLISPNQPHDVCGQVWERLQQEECVSQRR